MKKFYKENRVFVILMGIALVCIAIIIATFTGYIINSSTTDKYGNRLDGIKDIAINKDKVDTMSEEILAMEKVQDVVINIHGKTVNFNIDFANDANLEEIKNAAINCVGFFEEDYLNFYDLQFLVTKKNLEESTENYPIIGYRKAGATQISWSKNAKN